MHRLILTAAGIALLSVSTPASAGGLVEAGELEHARANARAGGPVAERDAELLEGAAPAGPEAPHAGSVIRVTAITGPATIIGTITEFGETVRRGRPHAAADQSPD